MPSRKWNRAIILGLAGILSNIIALAFFFIPQKGEHIVSIDWGSPQGVTVLVLIPINIILFVVGIFMKERTLSFNDRKALIEERQLYLPKLRLSIENRLRAMTPLIKKAETLPLIQYWEKYLKHTYPYVVTRRKPSKPLEITNSLFRHGFLWNNLYYQELKEKETPYRQVVDNYNILIAKNTDSKLKDKLDVLWKIEHSASSSQIFASLSMNNKGIPNTPMGLRGGLRGKHFSKENFQNGVTDIENRISELLRGDDL